MKKVLITRDNYEVILCNLLEGVYSEEVMSDLLDQIQADTFLSFEWSQWKSIQVSESTEKYRSQEYAFIEGLTRHEKKVLPFYSFSIAASIVLALIGIVFYTFTSKSKPIKPFVEVKQKPFINDSSGIKNNQLKTSEIENKHEYVAIEKPKIKEEFLAIEFKKEILDTTVNLIVLAVQDTSNQVFTAVPALANKKSRYTVSITEESSFDFKEEEFKFKEKRYTLADVMNGKDGVRLSKFMQNSTSRIITDTQSNMVYIEYTAEDKSVLRVILSE